MVLEINIPKKKKLDYIFHVMLITGDWQVRKNDIIEAFLYSASSVCHHPCQIQLDMVLGVELTLI